MTFSIAHVDYLQRRWPLPPLRGAELRMRPVETRLHRVVRTGAFLHARGELITQQREVSPSKDVIVGLFGLKIPLAFLVSGGATGLAVHLGVWAASGGDNATIVRLNVWADVLQSLMAGTYPGFEALAADPPVFTSEPCLGALVMGVPTFVSPRAGPGLQSIDRIVQACTSLRPGQGELPRWAALVLAEPIDEDAIAARRDVLLSEYLDILATSQAAGAPNPMLEVYTKLLKHALWQTERGLADGAWRTGVYVVGDTLGFARLTTTWRSVFQGDASDPEPIRVVPAAEAPELAQAWTLLPGAPPPGPGAFTHPFAFQTFLTSEEVAAYVHLPARETEGFAVRPLPRFNVVPKLPRFDLEPTVRAAPLSVVLGVVLDTLRPTQQDYCLPINELNRHAFVTGMTGSGKTNTCKRLVAQLEEAGIPFLVVEPTKQEYRELLTHPKLRERLQIFTLGNETCAPLRLNPFEIVGERTPVGVHIDLLRSLFTASFGMWTPLPQILETCLHAIYVDRGWSIANNRNTRLNGNRNPAAYPTLSDLVQKVEEVTSGLGYHEEFTANARAALRTRLNSLRTGAKGRMLDVQHSLPMSLLLDRPTLIEMDDIGDDDDKAFLIGLLLIRLVEYRRSEGATSGAVRHTILFEEAHRLFSRTATPTGEEQAQPRAKAVETFANLLAEVRAYGQAVVVADQVPTKLAPEVIKNTSLKIVHRLVDREDRLVMAGAMAMDEEQAGFLATLRRDHGEAVVIGEGDEGPLMVSVPKFLLLADRSIDDEDVRVVWQNHVVSEGVSSAYLAYPNCADVCLPPNPDCADVRRLLDDAQLRQSMAQLILAVTDADPSRPPEQRLLDAFASVYKVCRAHTDLVQSAATLRCLLLHAAHSHIERRAEQYGWSYAATTRLFESLLPALAELSDVSEPQLGQISDDAAQSLAAFAEAYLDLAHREGPYQACGRVCGGHCLYRFDVALLMPDERLSAIFHDKVLSLVTDGKSPRGEIEELSRHICDRVLPIGSRQAERRIGACFLLQKVDALPDYAPWQRERFVEQCVDFEASEQGVEQ